MSEEIESTVSYDSLGRVSVIATTSGGTEVAKVAYTYDSQSRLYLATWTQDGEPLLDDEITLGKNSNRTLGESLCLDGTLDDALECSGSASYDYAYGYNDAGWLTSAKLESSDVNVVRDTTWAYEYATASLGTNPNSYLDGNLTSLTTTQGSDATTTDFGYDFLGRIEETSSTARDDVEHDDLGNLTKLGNTSLTYNQINQLVGVDDGTDAVQLDRLPDGSVFQKTTDGTTTIRYGAGNLVLNDKSEAASQTVQLGPGLFATLDLSTPSESVFTVTTLQSSNALLTLARDDGTFAVQGVPTLLSPHGARLTNDGSLNPEKPQYDWLSNFLLERLPGDVVLMGKRAYLPELARFTSVDPRFGNAPNPYNYANADFIDNVDPKGTSPTTILDYSLVGVGGGGILAVGIGFSILAMPPRMLNEYDYDEALDAGQAVNTARLNEPFTTASAEQQANAARIDAFMRAQEDNPFLDYNTFEIPPANLGEKIDQTLDAFTESDGQISTEADFTRILGDIDIYDSSVEDLDAFSASDTASLTVEIVVDVVEASLL